MVNLGGSVGKGGKNVRADVIAVQNLINLSYQAIVPVRLLPVTGVCDGLLIDAISQFQQRVLKMPVPDGRVDPGGRTLFALNTTSTGEPFLQGPFPYTMPAVGGTTPLAAPGGAGKRYTDNPNEVVAKTTVPAPKDVVAMLRQGWTELTEQGARTLTAQFLHETGGGKSCFNWNLGNVKTGSTSVPHMYLRNVWEGLSPAGAEVEITKGEGRVRPATAEEIKAHGWSVPAGKSVVVFQPPHPASRFRAYPSLAEGARGWMDHHKGVATRFADVSSANAGDCAAVANILKRDRYYTGNEGTYARNMVAKKAELDRTLGPAS